MVRPSDDVLIKLLVNICLVSLTVSTLRILTSVMVMDNNVSAPGGGYVPLPVLQRRWPYLLS